MMRAYMCKSGLDRLLISLSRHHFGAFKTFHWMSYVVLVEASREPQLRLQKSLHSNLKDRDLRELTIIIIIIIIPSAIN